MLIKDLIEKLHALQEQGATGVAFRDTKGYYHLHSFLGLNEKSGSADYKYQDRDIRFDGQAVISLYCEGESWKNALKFQLKK